MHSVASAAAASAPAPAGVLLAVAGLPPPDQALPVLASVNNREQYRKRADDETEEAHWYSAEEPDTMVEPQQVRLKSLHSKAPSVIVFTNKTTFPVRALWLDFEAMRPAVVGLSTEQSVEIQAPKQLPWTLDTHRCFPEQYKSEVKALLLCHKKLEMAASTASPALPRPS
ncbi:hypothetical protein COO60DRAFT_1633974 [Scenedesmus sp. NREL 46B-D3]|nr:hypothetical protein COO60DRAFT_1633974 [Scenedesmus sp. NREL 46B-D3]